MSIEFCYQEELHCLFQVGRGRVSLQDFIDHHRNLNIADPPRHLLILSDYRQLDPSALTGSAIEEIKNSALEKIQNKYETVKEAILVTDRLSYGLSRMFDGVVYSEKYEVNVFTDINEAREWLGLKPDSDPGRDQDPAKPFPYRKPPQSLA